MASIDDDGWFDSGRAAVRPDWIDYNGHMNVGYYVVAFDQATEALCAHLGIGEAYRRQTDALDLRRRGAPVTYDREVLEAAPLAFRTRIVDHDGKRLHLLHRMFHAGEAGYLAATNELMCLHVDLAQRRAAPFPEVALLRIQRTRRCGTPGLGADGRRRQRRSAYAAGDRRRACRIS